MSKKKWPFRGIATLVNKLRGVDSSKYLNFIKDAMTWNNEAVKKWQLVKLNEIISYTWAHSPFYRMYWGDHKITPFQLMDLSEIELFPVMTRNLFKENFEKICSDQLNIIPHKLLHTGGTTGIPMKYLQDLNLYAFHNAFVYWGRGMAGFNKFDATAYFFGLTIDPKKRHKISKKDVDAFLSNAIRLSGMEMNVEKAITHLAKMSRNKTIYIVGFPSMIYEFVVCLKQADVKYLNIKAIFTTGEMLLPHYRTTIEEYFSCKIWDQYGSNDGGVLGYECEIHNGYHYNHLESIIENRSLDNKNVGPLLITNLWNRSSPFIRYENGDLVELTKTKCECGRFFPIINKVYGRSGSILEFDNGKRITSIGLIQIFEECPIFEEIVEYQVVQKNKNKIIVKINAPSGLSQTNQEYILRVFKHDIGDNLDVKIELLQKLNRTARGKLQPIVIGKK